MSIANTYALVIFVIMAKSKSEESPLMQQHNAIKQKYPDAILLFRVGDFYETFGSDAVITSKILGITLTKRNNGVASSLELAGFPHHALDTYLHKLVKAGYRVAICDQLEDPKQAKCTPAKKLLLWCSSNLSFTAMPGVTISVTPRFTIPFACFGSSN